MRTFYNVLTAGCWLLPTSVFAIINGESATISDNPAMAAVLSSVAFGDSLICGGTVIGPKTILTAARCVEDSSASDLRVRVGSSQHASGGVVKSVSQRIVYPSYNANTFTGNLAILHTTDDLTAEPGVTGATLPTSEPGLLQDLEVRVYGWGKTNASSTAVSATLQQAAMAGVSYDSCASTYDTRDISIEETNVCFGPTLVESTVGNEPSICSFDYGGPVYAGASGVELYGIASATLGGFDATDGLCSAVKAPNVAAGAYAYKDWIESQVT